jgi:hypothetical protein
MSPGEIFVAFFASKLEDGEMIIPALKGILAITRIPTLSPDNVIGVCYSSSRFSLLIPTHTQDLCP